MKYMDTDSPTCTSDIQIIFVVVAVVQTHDTCIVNSDVTLYMFKSDGVLYTRLDTCCCHFLTIIAGVDLHFRHESELLVFQTRRC